MAKLLGQHEVVMNTTLWLRMMDSMRRDRYGEQQRSKWIEEALLLLCIYWPDLLAYCDQSTETCLFNGRSKYLKVTVHPLIDALIAWKFFDRPRFEPSRRAYSGIVENAVRLRTTLDIRAPSPPGLLVRTLIDPDSPTEASVGILRDLTAERGAVGAEWIRSCVRKFAIQRDMQLFAVFAASTLRRDLVTDHFDFPSSRPAHQGFYGRAVMRIAALLHRC